MLTSSWEATPNFFIHQNEGEVTSSLARALATGVTIITPEWCEFMSLCLPVS